MLPLPEKAGGKSEIVLIRRRYVKFVAETPSCPSILYVVKRYI